MGRAHLSPRPRWLPGAGSQGECFVRPHGRQPLTRGATAAGTASPGLNRRGQELGARGAGRTAVPASASGPREASGKPPCCLRKPLGHKRGREPRVPGHGSGSRGRANLVPKRRTREARVSAVTCGFPLRTLQGTRHPGVLREGRNCVLFEHP